MSKRYEGKKFKSGYFSVEFFGWPKYKKNDHLEIDFGDVSEYDMRSAYFSMSDEQLDEFLDECAKFKLWRDSRK